MDNRNLKIQENLKKPALLLTGEWLRSAGFAPNARAVVTVEMGRLTITLQPDDNQPTAPTPKTPTKTPREKSPTGYRMIGGPYHAIRQPTDKYDLMPNRPYDDVVYQARTISSGTIATCTGFSLYTQVDAVRFCFMEFCEENESQYGTWGTAWNAFIRIFILTPEYRRISAMRKE